MSSTSERTSPRARARIGAIAAALACALAAASASAQGGDEAARVRARELARGATAEYNLGRFEDALRGYEAAYEVFPAPQLLFNLGQCHRELGHHERAIFFYERYLAEMPGAPNAATVRELLAETRATHERFLAAEATRADEERRLREAQEQRALAEAQRLEAERLEAEQRRALLEAQTAQARGPEIWEEWWFWTLIGVAVAAAVVIPVAVTLSQQPVLPMGSLGVIDLR
ncbi:MAG: tetratricopeptide repeat protein [Sandaracinaceae bacterium]|nr:tetratricopeptide repeat protein [Sandaracinaceae bacterium]